MKPFILAILLFSGCAVCGQTPAEIEKHLLVPWNRMKYWGTHHYFEDSTIEPADSLEMADTLFRREFAEAINRCPACLTYDFPVLRDSGLVITTSADGKFRVYTWDNEAGGSMRYFDHVLQYRTTGGVKATMLGGSPMDEEIGWFPGEYSLNYWIETFFGSRGDFEKVLEQRKEDPVVAEFAEFYYKFKDNDRLPVQFRFKLLKPWGDLADEKVKYIT